MNLNWDAYYDHIIAKAYSILGLSRRTFSSQNPPETKNYYIYLSFDPNYYNVQLYGSHTSLNASNNSKYILNDFTSDYKSRLIHTQLLPLTYILDVMFFIKSLKNHHDGFNIINYIKFVTGNACSALSNKLQQTKSTNNTLKNFYFNRLPRIWNTYPS